MVFSSWLEVGKIPDRLQTFINGQVLKNFKPLPCVSHV